VAGELDEGRDLIGAEVREGGGHRVLPADDTQRLPVLNKELTTI
jgi:hypothetical protein